MSIYDEITTRVKEGALIRLQPAVTGWPVVRELYVTPGVWKLLMGPWDTPALEDRAYRLRADLDLFITGELVLGSLNWKEKTCFLKRLNPPKDEVWEFRSRKPRPAVRIIGRFAGPDCFIATSWDFRTNMGGSGSREFRDAIVACKTEWKNLFFAYEPLEGVNLHDYISRNAVPV